MTVTSVLLVAGAVTFVGLLLALVGWRGRRVGDHPYCRRCGFDLFGRAEGSKICSECGAELNRARAVVVGVRRSRKKLVWAGVGLLVPAVVALSILGYGAAGGIDWQKHKPAWWLAREAESSDVAVRDAALGELRARLAARSLSKGQVSDLVGRGLKAQRDVNRAWTSAWGDLIEEARAAGQVSDEQWKTYARQALAGSITLSSSPRLTRGGTFYCRLNYAPARVGGRSSFLYFARVAELVIDGRTIESPPIDIRPLGQVSPQARGNSKHSLDYPFLFPQDAPYGKHRGSLRLRLPVVERGAMPAVILSDGPRLPFLRAPLPASPATTSPEDRAAFLRQREDWVRQRTEQGEDLKRRRAAAMDAYHRGTEPSLVTVELDLPFALELLPPDAPVVEPVIDPELRTRMSRAISVSRVQAVGMTAIVEFTLDALPMDVSFEVFVRSGNTEWPVGTLTHRAGDSSVTLQNLRTIGPVPQNRFEALVDGSTVEVVLRPSAKPAEQSPDIVRYWGEEIVIRDVPLRNAVQRMQEQARERSVPRRERAATAPVVGP